MSFSKIAVLGLGKIGKLAAKLLDGSGFKVTGYDVRKPREDLPFAVKNIDLSSSAALTEEFAGFEAVLSCLPYNLNIAVAEAAQRAGIHYFDLTEDVPTTAAIIALSASSKGLMAPQCGLAPGFIGIVGASHIAVFDKCRSVRMRVGALPQNPTGLLGYAFNWSPEGVVNEYLNDCEVIEEGRGCANGCRRWNGTKRFILTGSNWKLLPPRAGLAPCATPIWERSTILTIKPCVIPATWI